MPERNEYRELLIRIGIPSVLFFLNLIILVRHVPLFWDSIQFASLHSEYFLRTDFQSILLSNAIDSGNPPFFGFYIALIWKTFGKSLIVSHLAMFPFLLVIVWATIKLTSIFVKGRISIWFSAIILLDTTLLAQATLVSPDVALVAFFLTGVLGIISKNTFYKIIAGIGLALVSSRGQMILLALALYDITQFWFIRKNRSPQQVLENISGLLPGIFLVLFYTGYHYVQKGWIGYHVDSPWAPSFELVSLTGFIKNLAVFGWRLIDFGHLFSFVPAILVWVTYRKSKGRNIKLDYLFLLLGILYLIMVPQLFYKGLLAHRYFLPIYLVNGMIAILGIQIYVNGKKGITSILALTLVLGMMSGHLWNYSRSTAQGWDAKLSYLPYNNLIGKAKSYIDFLNISHAAVGTAFPNLHSEYFTHLNNNTRKFKEKDLEQDRYVLYSNVMNDFSDEELTELFERWEIIMAWSEGSVEVILFKKY